MSLYISDKNRSFTIPYYDDDLLIKKIHDEGKLISMEEYIMGEENASYYRFSDPRHIKHYEFVNKYEAYKKDQQQLETAKQIELGKVNLINGKLYGEDIESYLEKGYIEEPTPTQFQEAHKKWRRILDERNEKITELERELHIAKNFNGEDHRVELEKEIRNHIHTIRRLESDLHSLGRKNKELEGIKHDYSVLTLKPLDINTKLPVLEYETKETRAYANKLKQELDKLRIANQEKDIEIQELRDQVTKQARRWLVPNFK